MPSALRLEGQRFNRWTVSTCIGKDKWGQRLWDVTCDCGEKRIVTGHSLKNNTSKSCGCLQIESATTHGMKNTQIWNTWHGIRQRCFNPKNISYPQYGGRGIKVCDEWFEFENFYRDMGPEYESRIAKGEKISLDRYPDNDGNYEPGNCRWATIEQQNRNMRTSSRTIDLIKHIKNRNLFHGYLYAMIMNGKYNTPLFEYRFGISLNRFREHIASQFVDGMNWSNHGWKMGQWELDHIIECYKFDLSKEENLLICFNYKNIKPSWSTSNRTRSKVSNLVLQEELI
jgi:hypothetical protein